MNFVRHIYLDASNADKYENQKIGDCQITVNKLISKPYSVISSFANLHLFIRFYNKPAYFNRIHHNN